MIDSQLTLRTATDGDLTANEQAETFVDFGLGGMLMTGKKIRVAPREDTT